MADLSKMTDMELASRIEGQDHAAFTEIYERYWQPMFIYALKRLGDEDDAADVVQDLFTTLWNRASEIKIEGEIKFYLYTAVRNKALTLIGKRGRKAGYIESLANTYVEGLNTTDQELNYREFSRLLDQEVENLPPRMRTVYVKSREEGLSHRTIAEEMGITEDSSKTTLNRALGSLRAKLTPFLSILLFFF